MFQHSNSELFLMIGIYDSVSAHSRSDYLLKTNTARVQRTVPPVLSRTEQLQTEHNAIIV